MKVRYPKGETVWVTYHYPGGAPAFFISSKPARDFYYLYAVSPDGSVTKLGRAKTPTELEEKYSVTEKSVLANSKPK